MRGARVFVCAVAGLLILAATADATTFNVTRPDDPVSGTCTPSGCSLRQAVVAANAHMGADTIVLPSGVYHLSQGTLPEITDDLTLRGAGAATTTITGATASGPPAGDRAGAIISQANLTVMRLTISGNTATSDHPSSDHVTVAAGGILETGPALTLVDAVVSHNTLNTLVTVGAGGAVVNNGDLAVVSSTVSGNTASQGGTVVAGGAVVNNDSDTATVVASTINGNSLTTTAQVTAMGGGMMANNSAGLEVLNSTFTANSVSTGALTTSGGGLSVGATAATITNSTFSANSALGVSARGGDIEADTLSTLRNSIVVGGVAASDPNCGFPLTSAGGNVESANQCGLDVAIDHPNTNPNLGPLQDNGGPTQTQALSPTSAAVDAAEARFCPATDQRGVPRPQGAGCDAGAYEAGPPENLTLPAVTGTTQVGSTLACAAGSWRGVPTFSFAWLRNGVPIGGARASSYKLTHSDAGTAIQCLVIASNAIGSTNAVSGAHGVAATPLPANRRRPSISGKLHAGKRVRCHAGTWTGLPKFTFAWLLDGKSIRGAHKAKFRIPGRAVGHALQCKVTARNAGGSVVAFSAPRVPTRH